MVHPPTSPSSPNTLPPSKNARMWAFTCSGLQPRAARNTASEAAAANHAMHSNRVHAAASHQLSSGSRQQLVQHSSRPAAAPVLVGPVGAVAQAHHRQLLNQLVFALLQAHVNANR